MNERVRPEAGKWRRCMDIRLIALDLDGTLLNSSKKISERNRRALQAAADRGVWIVPCTGRFYKGVPEVVRELPFVRYVITVNGSEVYDREEDRILYRAELAPSLAEEIFDYIDKLPVLYDCYQDGWGWINEDFRPLLSEYIQDRHVLDMEESLRTPLANFRETMRCRNMPVQKVQLFFRQSDLDIRERELVAIARAFPDVAVSSAIYYNLEINSRDAQKGRALRELCAHLGIDPACAMTFGDGLNDVSMLKEAGVGVAMGNAFDQVKAEANLVAPTNDEDGVAQIIEQYVLGQGK